MLDHDAAVLHHVDAGREQRLGEGIVADARLQPDRRRTLGEEVVEVRGDLPAITPPGWVFGVVWPTLYIMLGLSLFIVPGIWIMMRLAFSELILVLRQEPPLRALQASFTLTEGRFWPVFACLANVLVPLWLLDWWTQPSQSDTLLWVLHQTGNGFLQLFAIVVLFRLFMLLEPQQAANSENSD